MAEEKDADKPSLKDLWESARTPADYASIVVGGTVGLALDAVVFVHSGIPTPTATVLGAGGLYSIKKSWDAGRDARKRRKQARTARKKAQKLIAQFGAAGYVSGAAALQAQLDMCEEGDIDDQYRLARALESARTDFVAWVKASQAHNDRPEPDSRNPPQGGE
ncbi:hypothetical protein [Mycobacterium sp. SP-6446]|uniref:hypothetical protein n=1 Tax=Mycobacterium sp. SP-6446 TaxID=1834162 RepID=UPI00096C7536|nr:hypothetical protein [Mycobacterium sp. SP-6446]OMC17175.1 hypothetical protein A5736_16745 [Mycobacterium sp. SP-6446]